MDLFTPLAAAAVLVLLVVAFFGTLGRFSARVARNRAPLVLTGSAAVLVPVFLHFFYTPPAFDIGPQQPIAFSHRLHAGDKAIDCQFCHPYAGRSIHPGLPPVEKCLYCHRYIITRFPEILKEHEYFDSGTPTPWVKANYLAEHVVFNHQRHIRKEIDCAACHGEVRSQDRIKGTHFFMGFCIECHRRKNAPVDCWLACHN